MALNGKECGKEAALHSSVTQLYRCPLRLKSAMKHDKNRKKPGFCQFNGWQKQLYE